MRCSQRDVIYKSVIHDYFYRLKFVCLLISSLSHHLVNDFGIFVIYLCVIIPKHLQSNHRAIVNRSDLWVNSLDLNSFCFIVCAKLLDCGSLCVSVIFLGSTPNELNKINLTQFIASWHNNNIYSNNIFHPRFSFSEQWHLLARSKNQYDHNLMHVYFNWPRTTLT